MTSHSESSFSWLPLVVFAAVVLFLLGASGVAMSMVWVSSEAQRGEITLPENASARRCPECGWIESLRDIPAGTDNRAVRVRQYTVRMVDGTTREFTGEASSSGGWRVGERLTIIGGQASM